jgi:hypothetical protein
MANPRTNRDLESREKTNRSIYVPTSSLPDPTPEPGMSFRWVATAILGQANPTNVSQKMREGYEPVKAVDHPELMLTGDKNGNVEIGGLMLCKIPTEKLEARKEHFDYQSEQQMASVDNHFMRNNNPNMPLFSDKSSSVSRGSGFGNGSK